MVNVNLKLDIEGFLEKSFNNELEAILCHFTSNLCLLIIKCR